MSAPLLRADLSAGYQKQTVLEGLQFDLHAGERLGLLGPSGTGKSTLLLALLGLLPLRGGWARGTVLVEGKNLLQLSRREARSLRGRVFSLVPQSPMTALNPALDLERHFLEAWKAHRSLDRPQLNQRLAELFQRMGLPTDPSFLRRKPVQISVGQAQRCTLALALLHRPSILIADEPTASLDPIAQTEVIELLRESSEEQGAALLFVSHDLLSVLRLCSSVAVLSGKKIGERLPCQEIVEAKDPVLRTLLAALPVPAEVLLQQTRRPEAHPADLRQDAPLMARI